MKIAHLISSGGFFGAERVMLDIASGMNGNGTRSWVAAIANAHNKHLEVVEAAKKYGIPASIFVSRGRIDKKTVQDVMQFVKDNKISIIHTHNYKSNMIGYLAARKAKVPIVATVHGYINHGAKLKLYEWIDRILVRRFDKIILVDDCLKKHFRGLNGKVTVINNGVRVSNVAEKRDCFAPAGLAMTGEQSTIVIGTVGRLSEEKGHKYLLEAFSKVAKDNPNVRLLIVGDGELREALEQLAVSLGIREKVEFTGFQEDIDKFYSQMDIYVSSSLIEHFPLSILEAMSFGKAIIATNVGGTADLIHNKETGILIDAGSHEKIYQALLQYLHEPALLEACGKNAQQFVKENYSLEKMVNEYRQVYEGVL